MSSTNKVKEFKNNFYKWIEKDKNMGNFFKGKEKSLKINQRDKSKIDKKLEETYFNLYSSTKKLNLKGMGQKRFFDLTLDLFLKDMEYDSDFVYLELSCSGLDNILEKIDSQKKLVNKFVNKASQSENPFEYIKIFTRADSVETALLLPQLIKGRKNVHLVKKYKSSKKRDKIERNIYNVLNKVKGSAKKLVKLAKIKINPKFDVFYEQNPESYLRAILTNHQDEEGTEYKLLKDKGFLIVKYKDKDFVANVNSIFQINNVLPVYIINKSPESGIGGFYHLSTKQLFVAVMEDKEMKNTIQHELEHFIQDSLNMKIKYNEIQREYGAFLGSLIFGDDPQRLWDSWGSAGARRLREFIEGKTRPHSSAKTILENKINTKLHQKGIDIDAQCKLDVVKNLDLITELYNDFYKKNIGISYDELSRICK